MEVGRTTKRLERVPDDVNPSVDHLEHIQECRARVTPPMGVPMLDSKHMNADRNEVRLIYIVKIREAVPYAEQS